MSSREESVGPCQSAERRSHGRVPESLIAALQPLLHQYNVTPLQLSLRCAMADHVEDAVCDEMARVSGLRIDRVSAGRGEIVASLVRPLLHRLLAQVQARPGSVWVPDSDTLWESLTPDKRAVLMGHAVQQIKLKMTPVAQRFRCYPAGLSLFVSVPDLDDERVLDPICEVTGWDVRALQIPQNLPDLCQPQAPPSWDELLGAEELQRLRPWLERHQVKPLQLSILLAMADPGDWTVRHEVGEVAGLPIQPFQAEEEEIAAALREKVGSAETDLWRQMATIPVFFQIDRLLPLLLQAEVLPLKLVLRLGMANPKDHLTLHQIRLLTGFEVEPVEMTGSAIVGILERMLRQVG
jgi:hypothetical protein